MFNIWLIGFIIFSIFLFLTQRKNLVIPYAPLIFTLLSVFWPVTIGITLMQLVCSYLFPVAEEYEEVVEEIIEAPVVQTIAIQIGNSDNKLTQQEWSEFVDDICKLLSENTETTTVHFFGAPANFMPWQNAAWIVVSSEGETLAEKLTEIRKKYKQESLALTVGETYFI